jgi:uncharacterized delta-60 repeat protein
MTMRRRIWVVWGALLALLVAVAPAWAASARVDPDFGVDGIARTAFPPQVEVESFRELAATPAGGAVTRNSFFAGTEIRHYGPDGALVDTEPNVKNGEEVEIEPAEAATPDGGRLVAANRGEDATGAVKRYRADGSPDPSFGGDGTSETLPLKVEALAPLPSGKVLVAGSGILRPVGTRNPATYQVYVARLGADGKLDRSFGEAGIVKLYREAKVSDSAAIYVQGRAGEGAEVVSASAVVGLDASGKLDPSFGKGGKIAVPGTVVGAAAAAGETVLVAGTKQPGPPTELPSLAPDDFYAARYTAAGRLDPTYAGGSGIAVLEGVGAAHATAAVFGADGSATVGGAVARPTDCPPGYACDDTPAIVRFTADGHPDAGFGEGGIVRLAGLRMPVTTVFFLGVAKLAARPGGGVFAIGDGLGGTFLAALTADGSLDPGFAGSGLIVKTGSTRAAVQPVATGVDAAGDVFALVGTSSGTALGESAVLLRYSPEGRLDEGFGEGGRAYAPAWANGLAVAADGSSFVISSEEESLTELTPSGSLDHGFGDEGSVAFSQGRGFEPVAVAALADGDVLVGGGLITRGGPWPTVLRFLPDGRPDPSFGKGGMRMVKPKRARASEEAEVTSMAVDPQGGIVLAGSRLHGCCTEVAMLVRLDSRGRLDRSFGRRGFTELGRRESSGIEGLALRGGQILGVGTAGRGRSGDRLYAFRPDGVLDRRFGDGGIARVRTKSKPAAGLASAAVFSIAGRILVARPDNGDPLVAFSPRGRVERSYTRELGGLVPRRGGHSKPTGPIVSGDGQGLLFAWSDYLLGDSAQAEEPELSLRRVLAP